MFSTPSQYTNYKIRGKSRHLHYPYYGLYNLSYCFYIWLRDFISRYLFITSTERFSGVVSTELMPCCFKVETISRFSNTNFSAMTWGNTLPYPSQEWRRTLSERHLRRR